MSSFYNHDIINLGKTVFNIESEEIALMFLLGLNGCFYTNNINNIEYKNVIKALKENNIQFDIKPSPNNRTMLQLM